MQEDNYMSNISKPALEPYFLKNISEFYLFGAVIIFDMVLPGLKFFHQRGKDILKEFGLKNRSLANRYKKYIWDP